MKPPSDFPIRLTVCETAEKTHHIVRKLQEAGFTPSEISVICSKELHDREFEGFGSQDPAGANTNEALNKAGGLGALGLGAAAVVAGLLTAGGTAVMAVGAFAGLAIAGTFGSVMATRGAEEELADYYDQAITHGKIVVAVETEDVDRQKLADQVFESESGATRALPKDSPSTRIS